MKSRVHIFSRNNLLLFFRSRRDMSHFDLLLLIIFYLQKMINDSKDTNDYKNRKIKDSEKYKTDKLSNSPKEELALKKRK